MYPNEKIRDVLYNIEQFKFDAYLQPELKIGGPPSSSSNSSNSSTKSSAKSRSSNSASKQN